MEILTHVQHAVVNQTKLKKNVHQVKHQKKVVNLNVQNLKNAHLRKILKDLILIKQMIMEQINLVQNLKLKKCCSKKESENKDNEEKESSKDDNKESDDTKKS